MRALRIVVPLLAALLSAACSQYAHETRGVRVGLLRCQATPDTRVNVLITSSVAVQCSFHTDDREDRYVGETGIQLGIDASYLTREMFYFSVFSAIGDPSPGFLAGRYVGARAGVTVGLGVGVGALVGGGEGNLSLEPLALEASSGLGVAAGITYLTLEHAGG